MELQNIIYELAREYPFLKNVEAQLRPGGFKGLILLDLRKIIKQLDEETKEELRRKFIELFQERQKQGRIRYIRRILILDAIVPTDAECVKKALEKLKHRIRGKWRITLKTRGYRINRMEFIKKVAEPIFYPVDLENPEYVVIINILGDIAAISIVRAEEVSKRWRR